MISWFGGMGLAMCIWHHGTSLLRITSQVRMKNRHLVAMTWWMLLWAM